MAKAWFYQLMGVDFGPISSAELKREVEQGRIQPDTLVRGAPDGKWQPADRIKGLIAPPPIVEPPPKPAPKPEPIPAAATATTVESPTITIPLAGAAPRSGANDRTYHFAGESSAEIAIPEAPGSGEFDFFQMVGFEMALGTPLHQVLLERCRTQHLTITEVTRQALAEHLGRKDLLEQPAPPATEPVGLG
ncbi:MAG TPA: DUF4339 domain-containing protein [Planctomycetaceae bacterium]|nr:DUF4339 domain-containing protein [Planctomycetaceae bacterium]